VEEEREVRSNSTTGNASGGMFTTPHRCGGQEVIWGEKTRKQKKSEERSEDPSKHSDRGLLVGVVESQAPLSTRAGNWKSRHMVRRPPPRKVQTRTKAGHQQTVPKEKAK